jgi:hypothetical protein
MQPILCFPGFGSHAVSGGQAIIPTMSAGRHNPTFDGNCPILGTIQTALATFQVTPRELANLSPADAYVALRDALVCFH